MMARRREMQMARIRSKVTVGNGKSDGGEKRGKGKDVKGGNEQSTGSRILRSRNL